MNSNNTAFAKTIRDPLDFYPTPTNVTWALHLFLETRPDAPGAFDHFLDPAAGMGAIVTAMRLGYWREAFWHCIEIQPELASSCELVAENVIVGNALTAEWPDAHVIVNPPFAYLDDFWKCATAHRANRTTWAAVLTPVAWWNAEKRRDYVKPDYKLALGWRPTFRRKSGPGHKGSQDFEWSILAPHARSITEWIRVERPDVGQEVKVSVAKVLGEECVG